MSAPSERAKAKALGLPRYFTGKPCKRGHISERRTVGGDCIGCRNSDKRRARERRAAFPDWNTPEEDLDAKNISLAAHAGVNSEAEGLEWIEEQSQRLHVLPETIIGAIRLGWTLFEVERMPRANAGQLRDRVNVHKYGQGFEGFDAAIFDVGGESHE